MKQNPQSNQQEFDFGQKRSISASKAETKKRVMVFDLETQLGAKEVGGWGNTHLMRVAVGVVHDSSDNEYKVFFEDRVDDLLALLREADLVVGFNSRSFDYGVLRGYTDRPLATELPTFDILEEIQKVLGFRVGLGNFAENSLGVGKSADGLQSLKWFKEGKLDLIVQYCKDDVKVTRDLFLFGLEKKYLIYGNKSGRKIKLPVNWNPL